MKTRILTPDDLKAFINDESPSSLLAGLHAQQAKVWPLLQRGLQGLASRKEKRLEWYGDTVTVQFNPARMVSITANVDPNVVKARSCFLCLENLPPEQTGILIERDFLALANPMPIFPLHFTLAHVQHHRQDIVGHIESLLRVAEHLSGVFTVFFNGATAGASAPDHFHFQSCPRNSLPISSLINKNREKASLIGHILSVQIETFSFYGNRYVILNGDNREDLVSVLERLIYLLDNNHPCGKDMLNIIVDYTDGEWQVIFIPREKHRPDCFYEEGEQSLLISPGAVEMGGVIITAREQDFDKITTEDIRNIYDEVVLNPTSYAQVLNSLFKN